ncbi:MAG: hypothetical protein GY847_05660 [Proteobacteria bacterium]|nr:hypothetical protein [Pseudomonadota bacterium]
MNRTLVMIFLAFTGFSQVVMALETAGEVGQTENTGDTRKKTDQDQSLKEPKEQDPLFEVKGRIHTRWEMKHRSEGVDEGTDEIENGFLVRRARLKFLWRPTDWVMGVIQVGVERVFESMPSLLRDAYIHLSPLRFLELRVGQFKKPFSGLEMRSPGRMRVLERGEGNDVIVEDLLYGDRDLGIQLSGRIIRSVKLDYAIGVFNGSGPNINLEDNSKDLVGRLKIRPIKALRLGVNGSLKFFDDNDDLDNEDHGWAVGGDIRIRYAGLRLHLESLFAEDHNYWTRTDTLDAPPLIFNVLGILSYRYRFKVSWGFALEAVFKMEVLDTSMDIVDDEVLLYSPGINGYFGEYLRLMVQGEFRRSGSNGSTEYPDRELLMVQLCFDI